jgi:hypothetical protein
VAVAVVGARAGWAAHPSLLSPRHPFVIPARRLAARYPSYPALPRPAPPRPAEFTLNQGRLVRSMDRSIVTLHGYRARAGWSFNPAFPNYKIEPITFLLRNTGAWETVQLCKAFSAGFGNTTYCNGFDDVRDCCGGGGAAEGPRRRQQPTSHCLNSRSATLHRTLLPSRAASPPAG